MFQCKEPFYFYDEFGKLILPRDGSVKEGYDSHSSFHYDEYVLFNQSQVIPILLLTLGTKGTKSVQLHRKTESKMELTEVKQIDPEKLTPYDFKLEFSKLPTTDDIYYISLPASHLSKLSENHPPKKSHVSIKIINNHSIF